ncbi:hypothetical protein GF337_07365 [candidate division KSB1 bacterium]|nr:hypothetical protein [candidate division KSB1 bacterium]
MDNKSLCAAFILLFSLSLFAGGKYEAADTYLKAGDFELAAKEYLSILKEDESAAMSKDIRALTGAFISHYMLQDYKKSFAFCRRVLNIDKYNSPAILYAGLNLGALGKTDIAKKLFKYHTVLPVTDPYRPFIKARYEFLIERDLEKLIRKTVQLEAHINTQKIPENSVAVLYLVNDSQNETWDPLGKGVADFIISDLKKVRSLNVVSRRHLQILLNELNFGILDLLDENLAPRLGRLLNSRFIINGTFYIEPQNQITLNVGFLDIREPEKIEYTEYKGKTSDIFEFQKQIVGDILQRMFAEVTGSEQDEISKHQTTNFDAFQAYSNGLDAFDFGTLSSAYAYFKNAHEIDPRFFNAWDMMQMVDAMILLNNGNLAINHFEIYNNKLKPVTSGFVTSIPIEQIRLQKVSINLDLGYFPGNGARNSAGDIDFSKIPMNMEMLDEPPPPPGN